MKDMRVWFTLWLTAMVVLVALPAEGRQSGPLYVGDCIGGQPAPDHREPALPTDFGAWALVRLNGMCLHNPYDDAYPYVTGTAGAVRVPLRLVAEAMGGAVEWEAGATSVTLTWRGRVTRLTIGSTEATVGGQSVTLDAAPTLWLDRTLVSPAVIAQIFGAKVTYDQATHQVLVRRAGVLCAEPFCKKR